LRRSSSDPNDGSPPRTATRLVLRRAEDREAEEAEQLLRLRRSPAEIAEAIGLAEGFIALVRTCGPEQLRALVD
jgi:response regulator RpfG family c-di-GMP phosphodiesterase